MKEVVSAAEKVALQAAALALAVAATMLSAYLSLGDSLFPGGLLGALLRGLHQRREQGRRARHARQQRPLKFGRRRPSVKARTGCCCCCRRFREK